MNIPKCSSTNSSWTFLEVQKIFRTFLAIYPKHCESFGNIFSLSNLKCLQTHSGTFLMFGNFFKSSNGTSWNVHELLKKFQRNIPNCPKTNSSWIFLKVQKKFRTFLVIYPKHCELFGNIFSLNNLKCLQTRSGTFYSLLTMNISKFSYRFHFYVNCLNFFIITYSLI